MQKPPISIRLAAVARESLDLYGRLAATRNALNALFQGWADFFDPETGQFQAAALLDELRRIEFELSTTAPEASLREAVWTEMTLKKNEASRNNMRRRRGSQKVDQYQAAQPGLPAEAFPIEQHLSSDPFSLEDLGLGGNLDNGGGLGS